MKRFKPDLAYNFLGKGIESVDAAFSESESGEFVFHSDVIALEQENERLRKELSSIATLELFIYGIRRHDQEADFMRYIAQKALKVKP